MPKYRAWIIAEERMTTVTELHYVDGELRSISDENYNPYLINEIILMEFTGLRDKNGVEIFEHDVVKYEIGGIIYSQIVEYDVEKAGYGLVILTSRPLSQIEFEVTGNIYENLDWKSLLADKYGGNDKWKLIKNEW